MMLKSMEQMQATQSKVLEMLLGGQGNARSLSALQDVHPTTPPRRALSVPDALQVRPPGNSPLAIADLPHGESPSSGGAALTADSSITEVREDRPLWDRALVSMSCPARLDASEKKRRLELVRALLLAARALALQSDALLVPLSVTCLMSGQWRRRRKKLRQRRLQPRQRRIELRRLPKPPRTGAAKPMPKPAKAASKKAVGKKAVGQKKK